MKLHLLFLGLSFNFCCAFAQNDPVIQMAKSLVPNVVRLEVKLSNGGTENGFGLVTQEDNGILYIITAAHVTHGKYMTMDEDIPTPKQITVHFSNSLEKKMAREITWFEEEDLALLQVEKVASYSWRHPFVASSFNQFDKVRFVGKNQKFIIPDGGEIIEIDGADLAFTPPRIPGSSGAPLINRFGVVGIIIDDSLEGATALSIRRIRELLQVPSGASPYFAGTIPNQNTDSGSDEENEFTKVTGGTFLMGDRFDEGSIDEKPVHRVTVSNFYILDHEVTFFEYDQYCADMDKERPSDESWGRDTRPVINISWYDAISYCNWKSEQDQLQKVYAINGTEVSVDWLADGYRLPTEAEWEYAARNCGKQVRFGNGMDIADANEMNFDASRDRQEAYSRIGHYKGKTMPYGSYQASPIDLFDMSGNVWEWCWDWYDEDYYSTSSGAYDPHGLNTGSTRVIRGGHWGSYPNACRATDRYWSNPAFSSNYIGFRLVRNAP